MALLFFVATGAYAAHAQQTSYQKETVSCHAPYIIDGDTFTCNKKRIRLHAIDAPEMNGHCKHGRRCTQGDPIASRDYLIALTRGDVSCSALYYDKYGRMIAQCLTESVNLGCAMVEAGHAVERYGTLKCP